MDLLIGTAAGMYSPDDPAEPIIGGSRINHIHRDGSSWWAVDRKGQIHQDGSILAAAPAGVALNCVGPGKETTWVGATEARLYRLEGDDLVEDEDFANAPGRDHWYTPWGGPPDVRSMAIDAAGALFVNIHVGGILRYDEGGIVPTIDQDADVHEVIAHPSRPGMVLAACALGLAQSANGADFTVRDEGLHSRYCRAVAIIGDTVLVSASTGPRTRQARLYRTRLEGGPFEACRQGLPEWFDDNLDTNCLAVVDGAVYAGHGDKVWRSDDEGESWEEIAAGLPRITCLA